MTPPRWREAAAERALKFIIRVCRVAVVIYRQTIFSVSVVFTLLHYYIILYSTSSDVILPGRGHSWK